MLRRLQELGITPMVCLHHVCDPIWVSELGGWKNKDVVSLFDSYVTKTVEALQEYTNLWITINEPNILVIYSHLFGLFPPGEKNFQVIGQVYENLVRAHSAAYHAIHRIQPTARQITAASNQQKPGIPLIEVWLAWQIMSSTMHFQERFKMASCVCP
jgi:beta-glucosidase